MIQQLSKRFSTNHAGLIAAQNLVPVYLPKLTDRQIEGIDSYYGKFLQFHEKVNLPAEVEMWKKLYESVPMDSRPASAGEALSKCSAQTFPALNKIFTIYLTTPVGSVACERSFSMLCRLKLWTRSSMMEHRLSGLAMLLMHRGTKFIPTPEQIYSAKANWRLASTIKGLL